MQKTVFDRPGQMLSLLLVRDHGRIKGRENGSELNGINIYVNLSYKTAKHRCHINAFVTFENTAKSSGTLNVVSGCDSTRCSIQIEASQH